MTAGSEPVKIVEPDRAGVAALGSGRRRLLRGGLGAAPVLMTLVSGPVSAALCTTGSAFGSLHPSGKQPGINCAGRSPEAWSGSAAGQWPLPQNDLFSSKFTPALNPDIRFKNLLELTTFSIDQEVARHVVAAYFNASAPASTTASVLSTATAVAIWASYAGKGGGLVGWYEPTAGIKWFAADIIKWIKTTYL